MHARMHMLVDAVNQASQGSKVATGICDEMPERASKGEGYSESEGEREMGCIMYGWMDG